MTCNPVCELVTKLFLAFHITGTFRSVRISLAQRDLRKTVLSILETCGLPTSYVDSIEPHPEKPRFKRLNMNEVKFDENDPVYGSFILKQQIKKAKDAEKLT